MADGYCGNKGLFTLLLLWKKMGDSYCGNKELFTPLLS